MLFLSLNPFPRKTTCFRLGVVEGVGYLDVGGFSLIGLGVGPAPANLNAFGFVPGGRGWGETFWFWVSLKRFARVPMFPFLPLPSSLSRCNKRRTNIGNQARCNHAW